MIAVIKDLSDTPQSESNTNTVTVKQGKTRGPQPKKKQKKRENEIIINPLNGYQCNPANEGGSVVGG